MAMKLKKFRKFRNKEDGSVTVEFVLWFPIYILLVLFVVDATILFTGKTGLWTVASHTSRQVALGRMTTVEAKIYAEGLAVGGQVFTAEVTTTGDTVKTVVTRTFANASGLGFLEDLLPAGAALSAVAFYRIEPSI